jgi:hypothetical protein
VINHGWIEDLSAVVALTLFLGCIAIWAIVIGG